MKNEIGGTQQRFFSAKTTFFFLTLAIKIVLRSWSMSMRPRSNRTVGEALGLVPQSCTPWKLGQRHEDADDEAGLSLEPRPWTQANIALPVSSGGRSVGQH